MLATPGAETPVPQRTNHDRPELYRYSSSGSNSYSGSGHAQQRSSSPAMPPPSPSTQRFYAPAPPSDVSWGMPPPTNGSGRNSASIYGRPTPERTMSRSSINEPTRSKTPHSRPGSSVGGMPPNIARGPSPANPHYSPAPLPDGLQYPEPVNRMDPPSRLDTTSPRSVSSRHSGGHRRSVSLNASAGMTPANAPHPLSSAAQPMLRRVSSNASASSAGSGHRLSDNYSHYNPKEYVDPAFLASSDDLTNMQSPGTLANTRANASRSSQPLKNPYFSPSTSFSALHGSSAY